MTPEINRNLTVFSNEIHYKGVRKLQSGSYAAEIRDFSQRRFVRQLGTFDTAVEAARTYDTAARRYLHPRTIINFPLATDHDGIERTRNYLSKLNRRNVISIYNNNDIGSSSRSGDGTVRMPMPNENPNHEFRRFTTITGEGLLFLDSEIVGVAANDGNSSEPLNLELSLAPPESM